MTMMSSGCIVCMLLICTTYSMALNVDILDDEFYPLNSFSYLSVDNVTGGGDGDDAIRFGFETSYRESEPPFPSAKQLKFPNLHHKRSRVLNDFIQAYSSYVLFAFPFDELRPISCDGADTLGGISVTLFDVLPSLLVFGLDSEFVSVVHSFALYNYSFNIDTTVSLFETTVRVLGALVSAHDLALHPRYSPYQRPPLCSDIYAECGVRHSEFIECMVPHLISTRNTHSSMKHIEACMKTSPYYRTDNASVVSCVSALSRYAWWRCVPYNDQLLTLAVDLADRLLPAFKTPTGLPYTNINLRRGVLINETRLVSTAGAGTLYIEWAMLSILTDNKIYMDMSRRALLKLWEYRSPNSLLGIHINVTTGTWFNSHVTIGGDVDSFYEYLLKAAVLFHDTELMTVFNSAYPAVEKFLGKRFNVNVTNGESVYNVTRKYFFDIDMLSLNTLYPLWQSLQAFIGGLQVMSGDVNDAFLFIDTSIREIVARLGTLPERVNVYNNYAPIGGYYLRPELIESAFYLSRAVAGHALPTHTQMFDIEMKAGVGRAYSAKSRKNTKIDAPFDISDDFSSTRKCLLGHRDGCVDDSEWLHDHGYGWSGTSTVLTRFASDWKVYRGSKPSGEDALWLSVNDVGGYMLDMLDTKCSTFRDEPKYSRPASSKGCWQEMIRGIGLSSSCSARYTTVVSEGIDYTLRQCTGYASISDVTTMKKENRMESFILSESLQYLYLLFDPSSPYGCGDVVFTTEAHPVPLSSSHSAPPCTCTVRPPELGALVPISPCWGVQSSHHSYLTIAHYNDEMINIQPDLSTDNNLTSFIQAVMKEGTRTSVYDIVILNTVTGLFEGMVMHNKETGLSEVFSHIRNSHNVTCILTRKHSTCPGVSMPQTRQWLLTLYNGEQSANVKPPPGPTVHMLDNNRVMIERCHSFTHATSVVSTLGVGAPPGIIGIDEVGVLSLYRSVQNRMVPLTSVFVTTASFGQMPPKYPEQLTIAMMPIDLLYSGNDQACLPFKDTYYDMFDTKDIPVFLVVKRGGCSFMEKALAVSRWGANGMLVLDDNPSQNMEVQMAVDGTGREGAFNKTRNDKGYTGDHVFLLGVGPGARAAWRSLHEYSVVLGALSVQRRAWYHAR